MRTHSGAMKKCSVDLCGQKTNVSLVFNWWLKGQKMNQSKFRTRDPRCKSGNGKK